MRFKGVVLQRKGAPGREQKMITMQGEGGHPFELPRANIDRVFLATGSQSGSLRSI